MAEQMSLEALTKARAEAKKSSEGKRNFHSQGGSEVIASCLIKVRRMSELRQQDLAAGLSIGRAQVANIEGARSGVSLEQFIAWCYICGENPTEVLTEITDALGLNG